MDFPQWLIESIVASILGLIGFVLTGFIWLIRLGARVSELEKHEMSSKQQLISVTKEANATVLSFTKSLAEAREQALLTFTPDADFKRLEDKVDDLSKAVASLGPSPPKASRQRRRRVSSASGE